MVGLLSLCLKQPSPRLSRVLSPNPQWLIANERSSFTWTAVVPHASATYFVAACFSYSCHQRQQHYYPISTIFSLPWVGTHSRASIALACHRTYTPESRTLPPSLFRRFLLMSPRLSRSQANSTTAILTFWSLHLSGTPQSLHSQHTLFSPSSNQSSMLSERHTAAKAFLLQTVCGGISG